MVPAEQRPAQYSSHAEGQAVSCGLTLTSSKLQEPRSGVLAPKEDIPQHSDR